jgi:hypothetical protein
LTESAPHREATSTVDTFRIQHRWAIFAAPILLTRVSMKRDMNLLFRAVLLSSVIGSMACGTAPGYARSESVTQTTTTTTATAASPTVQTGEIVVHQQPSQTPVIIVPMPTAAQPVVALEQTPVPAPTPEPAAAPEPVSAPVAAPTAAFSCEGDQELRLFNRHVNGNGGLAVYASGNCHVILDEVILRGEPAVVAVGNARVDVIETRIYGDLVSSGGATVTTRGSRHHAGSVVHN